MAGKDSASHSELGPMEGMLRAFAIHTRIHFYLLDGLAAEAWLAKPPGGKGRTLAAMAAHIHNVRLMWLDAAKFAPLPAKLDKEASVSEVKAALEASAAAMTEFLAGALVKGKVSNFKPDAWAFVAYLIAHGANHRGQMMQLARLLGFPVSQKVNFGLWEWGVR
jgi:uncharacterized damage-inducible protein DinB